MSIEMNIHEAKAKLSYLIQQMEAGETVRICRRNTPIAELKPVAATSPQQRPVGLCAAEFTVPDAFSEPLSEEELALWNGEDSSPHA